MIVATYAAGSRQPTNPQRKSPHEAGLMELCAMRKDSLFEPLPQGAYPLFQCQFSNLRNPYVFTQKAAGRNSEIIEAGGMSADDLSGAFEAVPWLTARFNEASQILLVWDLTGIMRRPPLVRPDRLAIAMFLPSVEGGSRKSPLFVAWRRALVSMTARTGRASVTLYGSGILSLRADTDHPGGQTTFSVAPSARAEALPASILSDVAALAPCSAASVH